MIAGDTAWLEEYRAQLPERLYKCLEKVKAFDFALWKMANIISKAAGHCRLNLRVRSRQ